MNNNIYSNQIRLYKAMIELNSKSSSVFADINKHIWQQKLNNYEKKAGLSI